MNSIDGAARLEEIKVAIVVKIHGVHLNCDGCVPRNELVPLRVPRRVRHAVVRRNECGLGLLREGTRPVVDHQLVREGAVTEITEMGREQRGREKAPKEPPARVFEIHNSPVKPDDRVNIAVAIKIAESGGGA